MQIDQNLAKREAAAWMTAAKDIEASMPGLFARMEQQMLATGKMYLDLVEASAIAESYSDRWTDPDLVIRSYLGGGVGSAQDKRALRSKIAEHAQLIAGVGNHRFSQQTISFDPVVADLLSGEGAESALSDVANQPLPVDVLTRLPFRTFVIVPNHGDIVSFLVSWAARGTGAGQRLMLTATARVRSEDGQCTSVMSGAVLKPGASLLESIRASETAYRPVSTGAGQFGRERMDVAATVLSRALPYLLYLAAENRDLDLDDLPIAPVITRTKRGNRIFPREGLSIISAGVRVGAAITGHRATKALSDAAGVDVARETSMAPHLRRAHWHLYWKGPRSEPQNRTPILHFLPPVPVNVNKLGLIQPVVRPAAARPA